MLMPQSYNPEHQTQIYDLKQDDVEIVGKVVECKVGFLYLYRLTNCIF